MRFSKKNIVWFALFLLFFIAYIAAYYFAPKNIDWSFDFRNNSTNPYGAMVMYKGLKKEYPKVIDNKKSYYQLFKMDLQQQYLKNSLMFILTYTYEPQKPDVEELFDFVESGNDVLISASYIKGLLKDSLEFDYNPYFYSKNDTVVSEVLFNNAPQSYRFYKQTPGASLVSYDTTNTTVLGYNEKKEANFIRIKKGKGNFYIHLQPLFFTNYHLLYSNHEYAFNIISALNPKHIIWDSYSNPYNNAGGSPIRVLLSKKSFKYAYFVMLFSLILYVLFKIKRKQAIIPVIEPMKNESLDFAKTLSRVYLKKNNNKNIAIKRFKYLIDNIRKRYFIKEGIGNKNLPELIIKKNIADKELVFEIFSKYNRINSQESISDDELITFNKLVEKFEV